MAMLMLLSLYITAIQLTSSQSTYDVIQQENDVSSCGRTHQVMSQLSQIQTSISELMTDVSTLQRNTAVTGLP